MEVSVIVARSADGSLRSYVPVENRHKNHILDETIAPANLPDELAGRAEAIARHLAKEIELVGLLAVEMFVTHDDQLLVHELAPPPHNSGPWTIDASIPTPLHTFPRPLSRLLLCPPPPSRAPRTREPP